MVTYQNYTKMHGPKNIKFWFFVDMSVIFTVWLKFWLRDDTFVPLKLSALHKGLRLNRDFNHNKHYWPQGTVCTGSTAMPSIFNLLRNKPCYTGEDANDNNSHAVHNRNKLQIHTLIQWSTKNISIKTSVTTHRTTNHAEYSRNVNHIKIQIYTGEYSRPLHTLRTDTNSTPDA